jgi:hypothetical protein
MFHIPAITETHKPHYRESTGETIYYPKKYNNYDEFRKEYVVELLAERLKMLNDISTSDPKPNHTPLQQFNLESNEISIIRINEIIKLSKIFGPNYDRNNLYADVKIRLQHIINIASYLRDVVQNTEIKEKLTSLIEKYRLI